MKTNAMRALLQEREGGRKVGIPSWCTGNDIVLETAIMRAKKYGYPVLIEATANQVNQFGGYTGQKPVDFFNKIRKMICSYDLPEDQVVLAGDHLGPLTWKDLPENEAMANARELVYQFVRAGFTKIHLDTSMKLADDPAGVLSTETIARRGAELYKACMKAYDELCKEKPDAIRPVFVIGSEVPIPGGAQEEEEGLRVTRPEDFEDTVRTYRTCFAEAGIPEGNFSDVIAVVVQPGVEFGNDQVFQYDRTKAVDLCECVSTYRGIGFEGHSTDYQSEKSLRELVEDGIYILKVGPELTFALREALFAESMIERELIPAAKRAYFVETLEEAMQEKPDNWIKYYHGNAAEQRICRKYSYSDRARYYLGDPSVVEAVNKLFYNLENVEIPLSLIHQYMPLQYEKVRDGLLCAKPKELAMDLIGVVMERYEQAAFDR